MQNEKCVAAVGDIVKLKSGSPELTVVETDAAEDTITVAWIANNDTRYRKATFSECMFAARVTESFRFDGAWRILEIGAPVVVSHRG